MKETLLSAQVVFKPADKERVLRADRVTSENVAEYAPAPEDVERVQARFRELGFTLGPFAGNSLSITAPASKFTEAFRTTVLEDTQQGHKFSVRADAETIDLPQEHIPREMKDAVQAITFSPPPDFGPGSFSY